MKLNEIMDIDDDSLMLYLYVDESGTDNWSISLFVITDVSNTITNLELAQLFTVSYPDYIFNDTLQLFAKMLSAHRYYDVCESPYLVTDWTDFVTRYSAVDIDCMFCGCYINNDFEDIE